MAYHIGVDAGSKTVKVVILDEDGTPLHSVYRRHLSNIRETLVDVLHNLAWRYGDLRGTAAITGSAGFALADMLGLPFVQEVIATTRAVQETYPDADAVIELGGEDAKVMYLSGNPEQRMNATCAGGTGGFMHTIAFMLGVRSSDMNRLAGGANHIYPIASRCAVFAQTDVRPLLNSGAKKSDIAESALEAVVRQTITGLACGRPIAGTVVFLGGPCEHIPESCGVFASAWGKPRAGHKAPLRARVSPPAARPSSRPRTPTPVRPRSSNSRSACGVPPPPKTTFARREPLFPSSHRTRHLQGTPQRREIPPPAPLRLRGTSGYGTRRGFHHGEAGRHRRDGQPRGTRAIAPPKATPLPPPPTCSPSFARPRPTLYGSEGSPVWVAHATATGYGVAAAADSALGVDSGRAATTTRMPAPRSRSPPMRDVRARYRRARHEGALESRTAQSRTPS